MMEAAPQEGKKQADALRDRLRTWAQRHNGFEYVEPAPRLFGVSGPHRSILLTAQPSMDASDFYLTLDVRGGPLPPPGLFQDESRDPKTHEDVERFSCCRNDTRQVGWRDVSDGFLTSEALADRYFGRLLTE